MDLSYPAFIFSIERQFHCLSHFSYKGEEQIQLLQGQFPLYKPMEIRQQLDIIGSKFFVDFAQQPIGILAQLHKATCSKIDLEENKTLFQYEFPLNDFPNGIGNSALLPLKELSDEQQAAKYQVLRDHYKVWTCAVFELPKTNLLSLIAANKRDTYDVITLFTGEYAPSIPFGIGNQDAMNQVFWERHCLLNNR